MARIHPALLSWLIGGAVIFTSANTRASEYALAGRIYEERVNGAGQVSEAKSRTFLVCVKDCWWFIRTEQSEPGKLAGARETGSTNGHEIFDLFIPAAPALAQQKDSNPKSGPRPPQRLHGEGTVVSNAVPASCDESDLFTSHLWLMCASSCFFRAQTNREIPPLYDINACVLHDNNLTMEAQWDLSKHSPALPAFVAYMNTRGYPTFDKAGQRTYIPLPPPYNRGFTNAVYAIVGVTNLNGLALPTGFTFQRFEPANAGRRKEDLRVVVRGFAVITNVSPECSRKEFLPSANGNLIIDRRLMNAQPPIAAIRYLARKDRWLTLEEVTAIRKTKLRRTGQERLPFAVYVVLGTLFAIPALFYIRWLKRNVVPDREPKE